MAYPCTPAPMAYLRPFQGQPYHNHTHYDNSSHTNHHGHSKRRKDKYFLIRRRRTSHARPSYELVRTSNPNYAIPSVQGQTVLAPPYGPPMQPMPQPALLVQQNYHPQGLSPMSYPGDQHLHTDHWSAPPQSPYPSPPPAATATAAAAAATARSTYSKRPDLHSAREEHCHDNRADRDSGPEHFARAEQSQRTHVNVNLAPLVPSRDSRPRFLRVCDLEDRVWELGRGVEELRVEEGRERLRRERDRDRERERLLGEMQRARERERERERERAERAQRERERDERERAEREYRYGVWDGAGYRHVVPARSWDGRW
ncbi:hypothetical protein CAC42_514 [Sphaceloma murrayae]|uniref:Uncharacterized protein n=1 Tax=Sphaceloma murrayae TaxID=2082308 RepID=A0A2K1R3Q4_9PEZI|nr:hypothetical protein CAC42_514 [Sphaceloma murrayae]